VEGTILHAIFLGLIKAPATTARDRPPEEIPAYLQALLAGDLGHPEPAGEDPVTNRVSAGVAALDSALGVLR
jgi:hypothetical protein